MRNILLFHKFVPASYRNIQVFLKSMHNILLFHKFVPASYRNIQVFLKTWAIFYYFTIFPGEL